MNRQSSQASQNHQNNSSVIVSLVSQREILRQPPTIFFPQTRGDDAYASSPGMPINASIRARDNSVVVAEACVVATRNPQFNQNQQIGRLDPQIYSQNPPQNSASSCWSGIVNCFSGNRQRVHPAPAPATNLTAATSSQQMEQPIGGTRFV